MLRDILEAVLLAAVLYAVLQFAVQNTIVEGSSMVPNFADQEWLLVNKLAYRWATPQRGDVIVFYAPEQAKKEFIKRVIGLPGETVEIRGGVVRIDGRPLAEPWAPVADRSSFGPFHVPAGEYFMLGDNRPSSNDSRSWGVTGAGLASDRIIGKAWLRLWPRERMGFISAAASPTVSGATLPAGRP